MALTKRPAGIQSVFAAPRGRAVADLSKRTSLCLLDPSPKKTINRAICISGWATELDRVNTPNICTMQTEGHSLRQPVYPLQSPGAMRVRYCTLSTLTAASQRTLSASEHSSWFALRLFAWVTHGWPAQCGLHASEVPPWLQVSPPFPILACR